MVDFFLACRLAGWLKFLVAVKERSSGSSERVPCALFFSYLFLGHHDVRFGHAQTRLKYMYTSNKTCAQWLDNRQQQQHEWLCLCALMLVTASTWRQKNRKDLLRI